MSATLFLGVVLSVLAPERDKFAAWSEDGVLTMRLELVALPDNDLQKAQIKLTVRNTGKKDIVLNRALADCSLSLTTDLSEPPIHSDERDVSVKEGKRLEKPTPVAARLRFGVLKPGQSLSRTYDLAQPQRSVHQGHATLSNGAHRGFYYEAMQTYHVPANAKRLMVEAWYERGVWMMATREFENWYGQSAEKIGVWTGRARSNTLVIQKK